MTKQTAQEILNSLYRYTIISQIASSEGYAIDVVLHGCGTAGPLEYVVTKRSNKVTKSFDHLEDAVAAYAEGF